MHNFSLIISYQSFDLVSCGQTFQINIGGAMKWGEGRHSKEIYHYRSGKSLCYMLVIHISDDILPLIIRVTKRGSWLSDLMILMKSFKKHLQRDHVAPILSVGSLVLLQCIRANSRKLFYRLLKGQIWNTTKHIIVESDSVTFNYELLVVMRLSKDTSHS